MKSRTHLVLAGATALVLGLSACGGDDAAGSDTGTESTSEAPGATAADGDGVVIQGFRFEPSRLEVATGTTVVWENRDGINHTATSGEPGAEDGTFDVDMPMAGTSAEHTFTEPGTFVYFCRVHESMTAEVVVTG